MIKGIYVCLVFQIKWLPLCRYGPKRCSQSRTKSENFTFSGLFVMACGAVDILKEDGCEPPLPLAGYSGKFIVRIPPQLHRALDIEARSQNVSMNKLIAAKPGLAFAAKPGVKPKRKRA